MQRERMNRHLVWDALDDAKDKLVDLGENVLGSETRSAVDILRSVTVAKTLLDVPPIYVDEAKLDQLQAEAESVSQTVVRSLENLEDISQELDAHSQAIAALLLSLPVNFHCKTGLVDYEESVQDFTSNLVSTADRLKALNDEASALLDAYEERIAERQRHIENMFQERQEQLDRKLLDVKASLDDVQGSVEVQKTRLDKALNAFSKESGSQIQEAELKQGELREGFEKRFVQQETRIAEQAKVIVDELTEYEDQASRLVESTAHGTITADYGARAQKEHRAALAWSIAAVVIALGGLALLIFAMSNLESMTASETIWKSSVTLVLLAVAGYMGREAGAHRREERDAKRTQLDLNAFHPFLSLMEEDVATELRKEFAQRVFSRPLANQKNHGGFSLFRISPKGHESRQESQE